MIDGAQERLDGAALGHRADLSEQGWKLANAANIADHLAKSG
jgi:hypothetical protein